MQIILTLQIRVIVGTAITTHRNAIGSFLRGLEIALIYLNSVHGTMDITLSILLITIFAATKCGRSLLDTIPHLSMSTISVLMLACPTVLLTRVIGRTMAITISSVGRYQHDEGTYGRIRSIQILFRSDTRHHYLRCILATALTTLNRIRPTVGKFVRVVRLFFHRQYKSVVRLRGPLYLYPTQTSSTCRQTTTHHYHCHFPSIRICHSTQNATCLAESTFMCFRL